MRKTLYASLVVFVCFALSECCNEVLTKCQVEHPPARQLPGNEEELGAFCENAFKFIECAQNNKADCGEDLEFYEVLEQITPVLTTVCTKDTGFYEDLADNLPCIKLNLPQVAFQCARDDDEKLQKFLLAVKEEDIVDLTDQEDFCLNDLFYQSCTLGSLRNRCGAPARDVSLEILEKVLALPAYPSPCDKEVNDKIRDFIRIMETEILDKKRRK